MRLPRSMTDLVLGRDAYDLGARCDQIPLGPAGAGTAYVMDEGSTSPQKVRASWVSDRAIKQTEAVVLAAVKEARVSRGGHRRPGRPPATRTAATPHRPAVGPEEDW
jgi:hypothetical protein